MEPGPPKHFLRNPVQLTNNLYLLYLLNFSYTGALCGLGYRPQNWDQTDDPQKPTKLCSYHPDQDIELCFDVHFDNEDVHQMNKVRYFINRAFTRDQARYGSRNDGTKSFVRMQIPQELIKIQDAIAKHMTNLTNRSRISVIPRHFGHEFRWLEWPAHRLMHLPKVMVCICRINQGVIIHFLLLMVTYFPQPSSKSDKYQNVKDSSIEIKMVPLTFR